MQIKDHVLGIDTSNYTTSVAVIRKDGSIIYDLRKQLAVKQGDRGLRQSFALFQHIEALPALIEEAISKKGHELAAVAVSTRPRPVDSSYMPVFKAGESSAQMISSALNVPLFKTSHQEGHIEAVKNVSTIKEKGEFLCYHLSGGTNELLQIKGAEFKIIGGTKDISFGQVIDRVGVRLGMPFPCGGELDKIALSTGAAGGFLKDIPVDGCYINLSGIETQCANLIEKGLAAQDKDMLIKELFNKICKSLIILTENAVKCAKSSDVLFVGGVSSSRFLYEGLRNYFDGSGINIDFGDRRFSADNAVGTAFLGGKKIWP